MFRGTLEHWSYALARASRVPASAAYYVVEILCIAVAIAGCLFTLRRYPGAALFGLLAITVSLFSGSPQSVSRYVLAAPTAFIFLSRLGKQPAFDRVWVLASTLLMGLNVTLFTFGMWVA